MANFIQIWNMFGIFQVRLILFIFGMVMRCHCMKFGAYTVEFSSVPKSGNYSHFVTSFMSMMNTEITKIIIP